MRPNVYLTDLNIVRPSFEKPQDDAIRWLAEAHATSERLSGLSEPGSEKSCDFFLRLVKRFSCSSERISSRGHELEDFNHTDWHKMRIFRLHESPKGMEMETRQRLYEELVLAKCKGLFPESFEFAQDLIHVTCTGYVSPSPLQRFIVDRGLSDKTRVIHAYHMGCYAALPATRIASGLALQQSLLASQPQSREGVDVVHTELCTLHFNPFDHSPEQLVVQSLFADGFVRYRIHSSEPQGRRAFRLLAMNEIQVPNSCDAMTWIPASWGMSMTLSRDVPALIAEALKGFVSDLIERSGVSAQKVLQNLIFAIHPGGPKIIDHVQALLEIPDHKVSASRSVLLRFGNMSSATLPHIWHDILSDSAQYSSGTFVLSLAFGPGLTIAGQLMELM